MKQQSKSLPEDETRLSYKCNHSYAKKLCNMSYVKRSNYDSFIGLQLYGLCNVGLENRFSTFFVHINI